MRKYCAVLLCIAFLFSMAGCHSEPEETADTSATTAPTVITEPSTEPTEPEIDPLPMHAIAMPTVSKSTTSDDGTVLFTLSYQEIELFLNGSDAEDAIIADLQSRMITIFDDAPQVEGYAREDFLEADTWNPYFVDVTYTPTRIDQSVISLFGNHSSYSGGTHPSLVTESVSYDLTTGKALTLSDILEKDCTGQTLCDLISEVLSPTADQLYRDYEDVLEDFFSANLDSISTWYFSRSGLCFHFSPYVIAPYASGTIVAEIPYEKLDDVLKDTYLPGQQISASGNISAVTCPEDVEEQFSSLVHVELAEGGTRILLHPDAAVTDVRIEIGTRYSDGSDFIPVATVFAADCVDFGNGIVLTADLSDQEPVVRLTYRSGDQEVSAFIDTIQLTQE